MKKKKKKKIIALIVLVCCVFSVFFNVSMSTVFANSEEEYTNALEDLQLDENFNIEDYPFIENDYSLSVIQIAETTGKELIIYVYQPYTTTHAKYINMSQTEGASTTSIYEIKYLNHTDTLYKYVVVDSKFKMSKNTLRYYNLTSIYRPFISDIDEASEYDNIIGFVAFDVSQLWEAYTSNKKVVYSCYVTETIKITDKFVGFCYYPTSESSVRGDSEGTRSHFVAFSTNRTIDKLLEATVYYESTYHYDRGTTSSQLAFHEKPNASANITYSDNDPEEQEIDLYADNVVSFTMGILWWKDKYKFNQISTVNDFIKTETRNKKHTFLFWDFNTKTELTDEAIELLESKEWVLRFTETDYYYYSGRPDSLLGGKCSYQNKYTEISNVSVIRLKFETDGEVYELGVVDNMQNSSNKASNRVYFWSDWALWLKILVGILAGILGLFVLAGIIALLAIISPFIAIILTPLWWLIKKFFGALWWVITAPFKIGRG